MKFLKLLKDFRPTFKNRKSLKIKRQTLVIMLISAFFVLSIVLCALLIVAGIRVKQIAADDAKPKMQYVRGYIYHGPEVSAFRKCDGDEEYWVTGDVDNTLWKAYAALAPEEYLPIYAEMKVQFLKKEEGAVRSDYAGQILVKEVYHLSFDSQGCELDKSYNYLVKGNEPSWKIIIDEKRGVFMQEAGQEEVYAAYSQPTKMDNGIVFNLISGSSPMIIKIRKAEANESTTGDYYAYSAFVNFKDKGYYGQVLLGKPWF